MPRDCHDWYDYGASELLRERVFPCRGFGEKFREVLLASVVRAPSSLRTIAIFFALLLLLSPVATIPHHLRTHHRLYPLLGKAARSFP